MAEKDISLISNDSVIREYSFKEKANRFVLFLDIMGFKERIARRGQEKILEELTELQKFISKSMPEDKSIVFTMFSDSIVVITNDDSDESFLRLSCLAHDIMRKSICELQMPIKGAIAYGELTVNQQKQLYFGQPLIDAYLLEEELKCYSVILHYTVEDKVNVPLTHLYVMKPVKLDKAQSLHYCILFDEVMHFSLINLRKQVSGSPRVYIDNTLAISRIEKPCNSFC